MTVLGPLVERSRSVDGRTVVGSSAPETAELLDGLLDEIVAAGIFVGTELQRRWSRYRIEQDGDVLRVVAAKLHYLPRKRVTPDLSIALLHDAAQAELCAAAGLDPTDPATRFDDLMYFDAQAGDAVVVRAVHGAPVSERNSGWQLRVEPVAAGGTSDIGTTSEWAWQWPGLAAVFQLPEGWSVTLDREGPVAVFDPDGAERAARPFPASVQLLSRVTRAEVEERDPGPAKWAPAVAQEEHS